MRPGRSANLWRMVSTKSLEFQSIYSDQVFSETFSSIHYPIIRQVHQSINAAVPVRPYVQCSDLPVLSDLITSMVSNLMHCICMPRHLVTIMASLVKILGRSYRKQKDICWWKFWTNSMYYISTKDPAGTNSCHWETSPAVRHHIYVWAGVWTRACDSNSTRRWTFTFPNSCLFRYCISS